MGSANSYEQTSISHKFQLINEHQQLYFDNTTHNYYLKHNISVNDER